MTTIVAEGRKRNSEILLCAIKEDFAGRVLSFDEDAAHAFLGIAASRRAQGRPIADWTRRSLPSCTPVMPFWPRGTPPDFEGYGVRLESPWIEQ